MTAGRKITEETSLVSANDKHSSGIRIAVFPNDASRPIAQLPRQMGLSPFRIRILRALHRLPNEGDTGQQPWSRGIISAQPLSARAACQAWAQTRNKGANHEPGSFNNPLHRDISTILP